MTMSNNNNVTSAKLLILFREVVGVYCQNCTKHANVLSVQSVEFWVLKQVFQIATTGLRRKIMFLGSEVRPMFKVDNLSAICELIV
jgi:hypothetical protein